MPSSPQAPVSSLWRLSGTGVSPMFCQPIVSPFAKRDICFFNCASPKVALSGLKSPSPAFVPFVPGKSQKCQSLSAGFHEYNSIPLNWVFSARLGSALWQPRKAIRQTRMMYVLMFILHTQRRAPRNARQHVPCALLLEFYAKYLNVNHVTVQPLEVRLNL